MPDYSGVTWRVNYGEIAERDQFRVGYVGQQSFDAYFELGRADYTSGQNTERHVWNNAILNTTRIIGIDRVVDADTLLSTGNVLTDWANVGDGIHFSSRAHNVLAASY